MDYILEFNKKCNAAYTYRAAKIPVLPTVIDYDYIKVTYNIKFYNINKVDLSSINIE